MIGRKSGSRRQTIRLNATNSWTPPSKVCCKNTSTVHPRKKCWVVLLLFRCRQLANHACPAWMCTKANKQTRKSAWRLYSNARLYSWVSQAFHFRSEARLIYIINQNDYCLWQQILWNGEQFRTWMEQKALFRSKRWPVRMCRKAAQWKQTQVSRLTVRLRNVVSSGVPQTAHG